MKLANTDAQQAQETSLPTSATQEVTGRARNGRAQDPLVAEMLLHMPKLRHLAYSLCRNRTDVDDMVQETMAKAIAKRDSYTPDTNLGGWLYTIMRNSFMSKKKRAWREVPDSDLWHAQGLTTRPSQVPNIVINEIREASRLLPPAQLQALQTVGVDGLSYEEACVALDCEMGTIKSRVSRARAFLRDAISETPAQQEKPKDPKKRGEGGIYEHPVKAAAAPNL